MLPSAQCILIGDCGVGKTTLLHNATHSQSSFGVPTIGIDMISYTSETLRLQCWDTSGQQRFQSVVQMVVQNCKIIVYVFDATRNSSFQSIVQAHARARVQLQQQQAIVVAVCNKTDLPGADYTTYRQQLQQLYPEIHFIDSNALQNAVATMEQIVLLIPVSERQPIQPRECCTVG